ncbi:MAG: NAD(P)-dependent oxidoreductase [Porticoccaceae bacterium]|jgi:nucleoside-diphosphate-sugar epimerase|nr:NAD(P)-dependent oxidoreductase [Porticoccaceae bacterium]
MAQRKLKKVLITGANGFIGNKLMTHYQAQGIPVVGVDLSGNGEDIFQGDIGQPETISQLLQDCDVVVHTAALVSNSIADADMWRVNVLATRNLIAAAEKHKVRRFVQISSIVAYGNSAEGELDEEQPVHADGGSYVLTKLASEHAVLAATANSPMELVIIRPGDVYGPGSRPWVILPIEAINKGQFMLPAKGQGFFRPIFISDLIRGIALAVSTKEAAGEIFNLSCEGYMTTAEFFSHHYQWMNKRGPLKVSTGLAMFAASAATKLAQMTGGVNEASTATIVQLCTKSWFSIAKAERVLGWKPEVSFEDGMQQSKQWAQAQGLIK